MQKIDFSQPMLNLAGGQMTDGEDAATLGTVAVLALLHGTEGDGPKKVERFMLAQRIHAADKPVPLKPEEQVAIKEAVAAYPHYGPLVVGQAWALLDGADHPINPAMPDMSASQGKAH